MKIIILLIVSLLLVGCTVKDRQLRLIYIENPNKTHFYNFKGKECILSGEDIDPQVYKNSNFPKEIKILETYKNCDFHRVRIMKEREQLYWGIDYKEIERERNERK